MVPNCAAFSFSSGSFLLIVVWLGVQLLTMDVYYCQSMSKNVVSSQLLSLVWLHAMYFTYSRW
jgi:hypothetical protein